MKNIFAKKPTFDLKRSGHALAAIGQEFPLELIETDPRTALITLAFMFSNSSAMRCQEFGMATSQLALFAAQPFAGIDADHYHELRKLVTDYRNYCLQLDGEKTVHVKKSLDQADGFADDSVTVVAQADKNSDNETLSDYQRMIRMLTFILTSSEAVYELEQVTRGRRNAGLDERKKPNGKDKNSRLAGGKPDGQK